MTQLWDGIYGQNSAKKSLESFINSKNIPQAIIFNGSDGIGKDFIASRFSFIINGLLKPQHELFTSSVLKYIIPLPTGKNETSSDGPLDKFTNTEYEAIISEIEKKNHNPYYSIQIPKANVIKINSIREINKFVSLNYSELKYRVILISSAHLMNEEAQNALLKNLEEPPEGIIFILTTSNLVKLKETIRSRCWILDFEPLDENDIAEVLKNYYNVDAHSAEEVKKFTLGSATTAYKYLQNDFEFIKEKVIVFLRNALGGKFHSAQKELSILSKNNSENSVEIFLKLVLFWLQDVERHRKKSGELFFEGFTETFEKFNSRFSDYNVNPAISAIENLLHLYLNTNINLNVILFNLIFEINSVINPHLKEEAF